MDEQTRVNFQALGVSWDWWAGLVRQYGDEAGAVLRALRSGFSRRFVEHVLDRYGMAALRLALDLLFASQPQAGLAPTGKIGSLPDLVAAVKAASPDTAV